MDQELHGPQQPASTTTALACLDVLRGASVLVHQAEEALTKLLALQQSDGGAVAKGASPEPQSNVSMLNTLVRSLSRVLDRSSAVKAASCGAAVASGCGPGASEGDKEDGATGVDMKRPRVDAAAGGGHQQQEVVDSTPGTHLPYVTGAWPSQTTSPPARTASSMVLSRFELLVQIMGYLGGGRGNTLTQERQRGESGRVASVAMMDASRRERVAERAKLEERRRALGEMALVCRAWRDVAQHEGLWEPLAKELLPRLAHSSAGDLVPRHGHDQYPVHMPTEARVERAKVGYRDDLVEHGRLWVERRVLSPHSRWHERLVFQVEIWDPVDGFQYLHGEGITDATTLDREVTLVIEPRGPLFSVASRGFHRPQYRSMHEYLEGLGHVGTRVVLRDKHTGRKALLWDSLRTTISSVYAFQDGEYSLSTPPVPLTTVSYGPGSLDVEMTFYVDPEVWPNMQTEDDMEVPDEQKLYEVAQPRFEFPAADPLQVGRLLWSALGY